MHQTLANESRSAIPRVKELQVYYDWTDDRGGRFCLLISLEDGRQPSVAGCGLTFEALSHLDLPWWQKDSPIGREDVIEDVRFVGGPRWERSPDGSKRVWWR